MYVVHARNIAGLRAGIIQNENSRQCVSLPLVDVTYIIIILYLIGGQYNHYTYMWSMYTIGHLLYSWLHTCAQFSTLTCTQSNVDTSVYC